MMFGRMNRGVIGVWLVALMALQGACIEEEKLFDATPGGAQSGNRRPEVSFESYTGNTKDISINLAVYDADDDPVAVDVYFSPDDGNAFILCSSAFISEYTNPISGLPSGTAFTFVWDSLSDFQAYQIEEAEILLRFVANDGTQDGSVVLTDPITVTNDIVLGSGGAGEAPDTLDEIGNVADVEVTSDGSAAIYLNEGSTTSRDNREEEFLLIVSNAGDSGISYSLDAVEVVEEKAHTTPSLARRASPTLPRVAHDVTPFRKNLDAYARRKRGAGSQNQRMSPQAELVVGQTQQPFFVLADLSDSGNYDIATGIVGAVGDSVVIFVDMDIPIDWDYDCTDDTIDEPDSRETFGFDTCDLADVAAIFDQNIVAHLHDYFGHESDLDESSKITVFLSPLLNQLTIDSGEDTGGSTNGGDTGGDGTDSAATSSEIVVDVFVDPTADLSPYDASENPGSNYQEIIYLRAPDPGGFFNPALGGGGAAAVESYVTVTMQANIAMATQTLISYNAHFLEGGGDPEEDWLNDGLGLLAADLTGFGSVVYDDIVYYLDAPYYFSLTASNSIEDLNDRGFQYLVVRYLVDIYGTSVLSSLMNGDYTGADNIASAVQTATDDLEADFAGFIMDFYVAISTADMVKQSDGSVLVSAVEPFQDASTIALTSTEYYGAEGFQQGINITGYNYARTRTDDGGVAEDYVIKLRGADHHTFAPGITYAGYADGGYGVQFTRIGGLIEAETTLKLSPSGADVLVRLVRLNDVDPDKNTIVVERVFGAITADRITLNIFDDGTESVGLGDIDADQSMTLIGNKDVEVQDTDLYLIDLSGWTNSSKASLHFEVHRSMTGTSGTADLDTVMLAVAPAGDVPDPAAATGSYVCGDVQYDVSFQYSFLSYLYYQYVLTPVSGSEAGFDPVGTSSENPESCNFDFASEQALGGLLQNDLDEPLPSTLVDQILTYQHQALGGTSTIPTFFPYSTAFLDWESVDSDDSPNYYLDQGLGGYSVVDGEDAILLLDLPAGQPENQYILIVSGPGSTGPYELTVKAVLEE